MEQFVEEFFINTRQDYFSQIKIIKFSSISAVRKLVMQLSESHVFYHCNESLIDFFNIRFVD